MTDMIKKSVEEAINKQIMNEFYSAYLYLSMAAYCETINLGGFASWMRSQYEEERGHALRLFDFLLDRDGKVKLQAIDQPPSEFDSPRKIFEEVLSHEIQVTKMINNLYERALKENDYPTQVEMQWFITEQVEEEKTAADILEQIKMAGSDNTALMMIDRDLGSRSSSE